MLSISIYFIICLFDKSIYFIFAPENSNEIKSDTNKLKLFIKI